MHVAQVACCDRASFAREVGPDEAARSRVGLARMTDLLRRRERDPFAGADDATARLRSALVEERAARRRAGKQTPKPFETRAHG